ncbi:MAG: DUF1552 domain-containing protein, partial [Planctomycetota bacterium]
MQNRRQMLRGVASSVGAAVGGTLVSRRGTFASTTAPSAPKAAPTNAKRIIFFLQNQGFDPKTCIPQGMHHSGSLEGATLPEPIAPLEAYKDRLHIVNGLHGLHTSPSHSAFFGALGGYRGSDGVPPSAATVDYELSNALPQTLMPHLCIGMDSIENMMAKPTLATLSASGAGQPIFMHSNPNHLYQMLFGGISGGDIRRRHDARSRVMDQIEKIADRQGRTLPQTDQQRYGQYVQGFKDANQLRIRLDSVAGHLQKFAPVVDEKYARPEFETDWHDRLLDLGISALTSGITNTLT